MSTHSILSRLHTHTISIIVSIVGGLLFSLPLVLPAATVAASPRASSTGYTFGNSQAMDLTSVAVVRLVVTPKSTPPAIPRVCVTGLGVIASSNPTSSGGSGTAQGPYLNTILTDGSLLTCGINTASMSIEVLASAAYTNNTSTGEILAALTCDNTAKTCTTTTTRSSTTTFPMTCQTNGSCTKGLVLLPFITTTLQPYVQEATTSSTASFHITLGTPSGTPVAPLSSPTTNLVPSSPDQQASDTSATATTTPAQTFEAGTPLVNTSGQLVSLQTSSGNSVIPSFTIPPSPNDQLQTAWTKIVSDFYSRNYSTVVTSDSQSLTALNPNFAAATALKTIASSRENPSTTTTKNSTKKSSSPASIISSPIVLLSIAGLIVVVLLLLLISFAVGRRRREMARFKKEQEGAEQRAEVEAQRIRREEAVHRAEQEQGQYGSHGQAMPDALSPFAVSAPAPASQPGSQQDAVDLHCPNCGYPCTKGDSFCSQCRAVLAPSESGLHVRMIQPPPPQQQPSSPPVPDIQSPVLIPSPSLSEMPTLEMSPDQRSLAEETTAPGPGRAPFFNGHNVSIAAGSRSDPGIKRKQKPNEDSLLAVMGERTHNSLPQQFGLFVVADGMGGHANGQDASRLAIQTMVDRILPRLSSSEDLDNQAFVQLLVNGVQQANMAVYQRNLEHHADMGTTMTSAIVVGGMAYVANVGDSRTYMYREPDGLHKITHDHSVVASLVEAGIIRSEDIYTHPKRNQIYRSLGEKPDLEIDSFTEALQPGDKLLLCSDGLWEMVHDRDPQRDKDIQRIMSISNTDPKQTANALINAANEGGGEDNISVIVVSVTEATSRTGLTGFHMLEKPETVQIPQL